MEDGNPKTSAPSTEKVKVIDADGVSGDTLRHSIQGVTTVLAEEPRVQVSESAERRSWSTPAANTGTMRVLTMRKILLSLLFLTLGGALIPGLALAAITVTLSDGTTTKTPSTPLANFTHSLSAPAGSNHTLRLIPCTSTAACTVGFPSGQPGGLGTDTYLLSDISSSNRARIEKIDVPSGGTATTGPDSVTLRGIKIFSKQATARTFRITYSTAAGDLSTITSSTGNYVFAAKIKGQFRTDTTAPIDGLTGSIPTTCNAGLSSPCAQLSVVINGLTVQGQDPIVTTSIPCSTSSSSTSYCGGGGFWSPGLLAGDQFLSSDSEKVGCGTTCQPRWVSTLFVKTNAVNQVLTLTNSVGTGLAQDTLDGIVDLAVALGEPGIDVWVGSCGQNRGVQQYRVFGQPPFGNKGRTQTVASATFPMKFILEKGELQSLTDGFPRFVSIDDPSEVALPPAEQLANDSCSMSWVPSPVSRPRFNEISQLTLNYTAFVLGQADSGNPLLGLLDFSDCTACFRVEIQLVDASGVSQGTLVVYLGAAAGEFYRTDHAGSTSPLVLVSDPGLRVDAQAMADPKSCCITFADAQKNGNYGRLFVRSITVVIDPGLDENLNPPVNTTGNHLVTELEAIVRRGTSTPSSSDDFLLTVGNFQPSCEWPPLDGLKIYIYRVGENGERTFVRNVLDPTIDFSLTTCPLTASVNVGGLGPGTYEATVTALSGATDPSQEFIGGNGLPFPGIMILK